MIELYQADAKETSVAQFMLDPTTFKTKAVDETRIFREYMTKEAYQ